MEKFNRIGEFKNPTFNLREMQQTKRALVTGATGFVGSHLLYFLSKNGYDVVAVCRNANKIENTKKIFSYYGAELPTDHFRWEEMLLEDFSSLSEAVKEVDVVFHCAARVDFLYKNRQGLINKNKNITSNVVDACLEHDKVLAHVSSIVTLDNNTGEKIDEKSFWMPNIKKSAYAIGKYYAEQEVWRGIESGLRAVIVNPSIIIGENGTWNGGSSAFFKYFSKRRYFYIDGVKGFVDVQDVVNMLIKLSEDSSSYGQRYILNRENLPFQEFFGNIANSFNIQPPLYKIPRWLFGLVGFVCDMFQLFGVKIMLSSDTFSAADGKHYYDGSKVLKHAAYLGSSIKESVHRIVLNYRKANNLK